MTDPTKLKEPVPVIQHQRFQGHSQTQSERSFSSRSLSIAPLNTGDANDINISDFWGSPNAAQTSYTQADGDAQWAPFTYQGSAATPDALSNTMYPDTNASTQPAGSNPFEPDPSLKINAPAGSYDLPPRDVTYRLILHYTRTVHDWIPLVPTALLDREVELYYTAPFQVNNTRLAILHLVLAIGARHAYLTDRNATRQREGVQHFTRAVQLLAVIDPAGVSATPDVALVQVSCYGTSVEKRIETLMTPVLWSTLVVLSHSPPSRQVSTIRHQSLMTRSGNVELPQFTH